MRERKEDIPALFHHFLLVAASRYGKTSPSLSPQDLAQLIAHDWPGNVRELRNAAERFVLLGKLSQLSEAPSAPPTISSLSEQVAEFEKAAIENALLENSGSIKQTMEQLNVPRKTLYDKMQRYQIDKDIYKENGS